MNQISTKLPRIALAVGISLAVLLVVLAFTAVSQAAAPPEPLAGSAPNTVYFTGTAYTQIYSPEQFKLITGAGLLVVTGTAWYDDGRPSDVLRDPVLDKIAPGLIYFVAWSPVPSATAYILEEATDPDFRSGVTRYYPPFDYQSGKYYKQFSGKAPGTYFYRLQASALNMQASRWSNVRSVAVTGQALAGPGLEPGYALAPTPAAQVAVTEPMTVWVRLDQWPWMFANTAVLQPEQTWWNWTGAVQVPPNVDYGRHTIQARAENQLGEIRYTDTITILIDNHALVPTINNLTENQRIGKQYTIQGSTPSDGSGVARVQLSFDGGATWPVTATGTLAWQYVWNPVGSVRVYTITARAIDGVGNVSAGSPAVHVLGGRYRLYMPLLLKRWPPVPYAPTLNEIGAPDANGNYTVSWVYDRVDIPAANYTLQEATDAGFTASLYTYPATTSKSQAVTNKAPNIYYYRVRGNNQYGPGDWSNVRSVTVLPGAPTLNAISNPNKAASYAVSWSAGRGAASYELQEATASDFSAGLKAVYSGADLTYTVPRNANGTYYYRVRSVSGSLASAWSNVVSTVVDVPTGYFDDFSNSASGWYRGTYQSTGCRGANYDKDKNNPPVDNVCFWAEYQNGEYVVHMVDKWETVRGFVALQAPYKLPFTPGDSAHWNYDIRVDARIVDPGAKAPLVLEGLGLVYSGGQFVNSPLVNDPLNRMFTSEYNYIGQWAVTNYKPAYVPWDQMLSEPTYLNRLIPTVDKSTVIQTGYNKWNKIKVEVREGLKARFFINDVEVGFYKNKWMTDNLYTGLVLSGWDVLPFEVHFDNFRITLVQP